MLHPQDKMVFALIGPKGAGKSYIGRLIERYCGIGFVNVEALFLDLDGSETSYGYEGYQRVEEEVARRLREERSISLELTGASQYTAVLLERLAQKHCVRLVQVSAPLATCLERVEKRDSAGHLPTDADMVRLVHGISSSLKLDYDLCIDNTNATYQEIVSAFRTMLRKTK